MQEYPYDAAVVDVGLPVMDGFELIRQVRKENITTPILILTARDRWQEKVEGLEAGADDYLTKPFDAQELCIRAKNLVEQRRQLIERFSKIGSVAVKPVKPVSPEEIFLQKAVDAQSDEVSSIRGVRRELSSLRSSMQQVEATVGDLYIIERARVAKQVLGVKGEVLMQ